MENRNSASTAAERRHPNAPDNGNIDGATPVIPLPNPGEGPAIPEDIGGAIPVIPLPNPGEGPVIPEDIGRLPIQPLPDYTITLTPRYAAVRFLNATHGYPAFRILIDGRRAVSLLDSGSASGYVRITSSRHTIAAVGQDGYTYIQKDFSFASGTTSTVAIINRTGVLDMIRISDACTF